MRLNGRVAIVTGAGGGTGFAIAEALAADGAGVICADLDGDAAGQAAESLVAAGLHARGVKMDHTSPEECAAAVDLANVSFGPVDTLINNAGIAITGAALDVNQGDLMRQLEVNTLGPLIMTQAVLPQMIENEYGSVVMVASVAGLGAKPKQLPYIVSKHALIGLMRSLALDYGRYGVRVNAVCPSFIRTPMTQDFVTRFARRAGLSEADALSDFGRRHALGRVGEPLDVAMAVRHLVTDESAWTTGLCYVLDGGAALLG